MIENGEAGETGKGRLIFFFLAGEILKYLLVKKYFLGEKDTFLVLISHLRKGRREDSIGRCRLVHRVSKSTSRIIYFYFYI